MCIAESPIESLDDLRELVTEILCEHEQLEPGAFPVIERLLHRGGRPCGVEFCLHGPRSVRLMAIWEVEKQSVLFYDSAGERFRRVRLAERLPDLAVECGRRRLFSPPNKQEQK